MQLLSQFNFKIMEQRDKLTYEIFREKKILIYIKKILYQINQNK